MIASFPEVQEVCKLIQEAEERGFEKDRQCLAKLREKIIAHMKDQPKRTMQIVFVNKDFTDKTQCKRVMEQICVELRQKSYQCDYEIDVSLDCRGNDEWDGATLHIKVPSRAH